MAAPTIVEPTPLLRRLRQAIAAGEPGALERFWRDVEAAGTPLVAPHPHDPDRRLVTFLWRGEHERSVSLLGNRITDGAGRRGLPLQRLAGTDAWWVAVDLDATHRGTYRLLPERDGDEDAAGRDWAASARAGVPDPRNPRSLAVRWSTNRSSLFALDRAPEEPGWAVPDGAPVDPDAPFPTTARRGTVAAHELPAAAIGGPRRIWSMVPPERPAGGLELLVLLDGDMWMPGLDVAGAVDRLVAAGRVPPTVAVAVDGVDVDVRRAELGAREPIAAFLADELLPWARERWPIVAGREHVTLVGQSLGGLTALHAGLRAGDRIGRVIAQSPSLWWHPDRPVVPTAGADDPWICGVVRTTPAPPLDVRLHVGRFEGGMVRQSAALADDLAAAGHAVERTVFEGGHDFACWRGLLTSALDRAPRPADRW